MKGYRMNPDAKFADMIIKGVQKKNGYCPCRTFQDETTLCPCDEFVSEGICVCKLFVPIEGSEA